MSCLLKRFCAISAITLSMLTSAVLETHAQSANDNATQAQPQDSATQTQAQRTVKVYKLKLKHDVPWEDKSAKKGPTRDSAPAGAHLTYYGGRLVGSAQVIEVLWGNGAYDSHVSGMGTPSMASFYEQMLSKTTLSSWLDGEYNTVANSFNGTKTNQHITPGQFVQQIIITPSTSATTVDDSTIQAELTAQITAGHLPAPMTDAQGNTTTFYAVFFPPGITITQDGETSCVGGGFCAYHGTIAPGGSLPEFFYGVHPDMQAGSGCSTGCGSSTVFGNYTSVASHELVETITDAEVGLALTNGPPLAWYDSTNGEIGDICNAQQGTFAGCDGQSYTYQLEFSNAQSNCVTIAPSCSLVTGDFSISANPASLSVAPGSSGSSTISTAITSGASETVSLSVSGAPSGVTASLVPSSVSSGQSSTLSISTTSAAAAGFYTLTVTGAASSGSHATAVSLTITGGSGGGGGGLTNGGFETGTLSGWTASGASKTVVSSGCHGGTYCVQLGGTSPTNGNSSIAQTFTAPSGSTSLSFWYKITCPDTVTYDWATATLKDNTANVTATVLPKTCTVAGIWTNVTANLTAGHSYTLTLTSHDDNYAGDPTFTLYDDVTIGQGGGGGGITNGGFETGLSGWIPSGASETVISSGCHGGTNCAQLGGSSPTNGDSSIAQTFTVATGKSQLSLWYKMTCPDTVTYDWATVKLKNNSTSTTTTVVPKTCSTNSAWVNVTAAVTAGTSYTLTLTSHDDNYAGDPSYTLYDDIVLN